MRKFNFRLEPVLTYREIREDLAQKELADAMRDHARIEEVLVGLQSRREEVLAEMAESQDGVVKLTQVQRCIGYMTYLLSCIDRTKEELDDMAKIVEQRRDELILATKEKKALERVKQRDFEAYMHEARSLEQKFLDDVATIRHTRAARDEAGRQDRQASKGVSSGNTDL